MEWLNENAGLIALISAVVVAVLLVVCILLTVNLRSKIAVQRLNFLGFYSTELDSRRNYAEIIIGNKSLNDVGIAELGIKNGKTAFDFTGLYKTKKEMSPDARIVIEQRSAIDFRLTVEELQKVFTEGKNGKKQLRTLKIYAVDLTGTLFQGRAAAVKKLLKDLLAAEKRGEAFVPAPRRSPPPQEGEPSPAEEQSETRPSA